MVPAAAVIPSLIAFSYVAAVKRLVAVGSIACHFEKIGAFIAGKPLHSAAKHDITTLGSHVVHGSAWLMVSDGDR
jgi:hypothetical protein